MPAFKTTRYCPHCHEDMQGEPIPENKEKFYGKGFFRREIGVEISQLYGGVLYYTCPACKGWWHRWPISDYRHQLTEDWHEGKKP